VSVACRKGFAVVSCVSFGVCTGFCGVVSGGHLQGNSGGVSDDARAHVCVILMGLLVLTSLVF